MSSPQDYPLSLQKIEISNEINSTILSVFLWGIYTVVYIGTLYFYLTKKSSGRRLIVGALSLSYVAYSTVTIVFWYYDQSAVVNDSDTRESLFAFLEEFGPEWPEFVSTVTTFILAGVADGILLWRCFHVWGRSFRWILVPGFLLCCEIVIDLVLLILQSAQRLAPSASEGLLDHQLFAAQNFITFAATLTSTALIAYRIYKTSKEDMPRGSGRRLFKKIIEILLQSAVVYSVAAIAQAIPDVIPDTTLSDLASLDKANAYTTALFNFISAVAPTILVARVAMLGDRDMYSSNSSNGHSMPGSIQFHVQSTVQEVSHSVDHSGRGGRGGAGSMGVV